MRTVEQIENIKSRISIPYVINNFLSNSDIQHLITIFQKNNTKLYKNTGPITLNIDTYLTDPIFIKIFDQIREHIGPFKMTAGFFFATDSPHIIHNDDTFELPDQVYKGITIPLMIDGSDRYPYLCFFDQFYFHGPAKFFKGSSDIPGHYNKHLYSYENIDYLSTDPIDNDSIEKYFTHLKPEWLEGLSLHSSLPWIPTTAIVFDSTRLHCASDFRKLKINSKLAISIFTKY